MQNTLVKLAIVSALLCACDAGLSSRRVVVSRPVLNEVKPEFKNFEYTSKCDHFCIDRENLEKLVYNIKMSRMYYNQQVSNNNLMEEYYIKIISDLGGDVIS